MSTSPNPFDLRGRTALVTGASRGLGLAMARGLAQAGADVALCARRREDVAPVAEELRALGVRAEPVALEVRERQSCQAAAAAAVEALGAVDVLVNNAGVNVRKPVVDLSEEEWDRVVDTNLKGYFLMAQAVAPYMLARRRGKIIHISSILGAVGLPNLAPYAAAKGGVVQLTKVMALEWAQRGIQVNAIGPAYFETELTAPLRADPERNRFIVERTPMGRWGRPEELVGTLLWLASPASDFVTGQTVYVDGGWTAW